MEPGTIIEFSTSSGHRLGVVTGAIGKQKLVVRTADGAEMRPTHKDVTFELGRMRDPDSASAIDRELARISAAVEEARAGVDLPLLWEMALELGEAMTAAEAADLIFGDDAAPVVLATLQALREDGRYFKQRKDTFEPRDAAQVEAITAQLAAEARKAEEAELFVGSIRDVLKLPEVDRLAAVRQRESIDLFRDRLNLLQEYAIHGDDYQRKDQAEAALAQIEDVLKVNLKGRDSMKAFHLMVDLGLWEQHENLWLLRFHVNTSFDQALEAEAAQLAATDWQSQPWRRDLRAMVCYSIDDASTLDIDDAISCQPHIDGGWEVHIHIADPGEAVPMGSALDEEARRRGTSIYLPTGTIPMFPLPLSEGRMSLLEGQDRPALTTLVRFDDDLNIVHTDVFPSLIRVTERLTYDQVNASLDAEEQTMRGAVLRDLSYLSSELYQKRLSDGAAVFSIPDIKLKVSLADARPEVHVEPREETPADTLVSELMILANRIMGEFCRDNQIPVVYRCQEAPDGELIDEEILRVPEGLPRTFAMLRRMKRADISTTPDRHFGLGLPVYVQATSPIRRYGDLICQRQVKAFLAGEPLPYDAEALMAIAATVENTAREASTIERETTRYWLMDYMRGLRDELDATVIAHMNDDGTLSRVFVDACAFAHKCKFRRTPEVGSTVKVKVRKAVPREDYLDLQEA